MLCKLYLALMGSLVSLTLFADSSDLKSAPHTDNSAAAEENSSPRTVLFSLREAVISSLVEARVNRHNFKEGERFKANDVLTELDEETFRQRLLKSESALVEAKAATGFAERNLVRTKALHARGMLGLQDVERCEFEVETAKSKQTFHEANVKLAEQDLAACRISAPFPGRLVKILVQEHEFVKMGQPLLQIIDDYRLLAIAHLPSSGISNIKIGQVISINVDETGTVHSGKVYVISGEVDSASRTFEIKILIENPDGKLSSGMSGRLVTAPLSEGASE